MAARGGGHECEFVIEVSTDLKCPICQLVLNRPVQIEGCGHRFCRKCLDVVFERRSPKCPVDRRAIKRSKVFSDVACNRQILDLHVKCSVTVCPWEGELRDLEKHQKQCQYETVSCTNNSCQMKITRAALQQHVLEHCSWRGVTCTFCSQKYPFRLSETHMTVCKRIPLSCKNGCAQDIPQEEMDSHVKDVCPLTIIPCKYDHLGCQTKVQRRLCNKHVESDMNGHLDLACKRLKLAQEEITNLRQQCNTAPYAWKINNFLALARQAKRGNDPVYCDSPPFYIKRQGYKLQMWVKLFKRDQDVSVLFGIRMLPGEYDSILKWPLDEAMRLTVMGQQGEGINKKNIVSDDRRYFLKSKATVGTELEFIESTLTRLQKRGYLANDAVFVKFEVCNDVETAARYAVEASVVADSSSEDSDRFDDDLEDNDLEDWYEDDDEDEVDEASNLDADDGTNDNEDNDNHDDDDDDDYVQLIEEEEEEDWSYELREAAAEGTVQEGDEGDGEDDEEVVVQSEESEDEESCDDREELAARGETSGSCRMQ